LQEGAEKDCSIPQKHPADQRLKDGREQAKGRKKTIGGKRRTKPRECLCANCRREGRRFAEETPTISVARRGKEKSGSGSEQSHKKGGGKKPKTALLNEKKEKEIQSGLGEALPAGTS